MANMKPFGQFDLYVNVPHVVKHGSNLRIPLSRAQQNQKWQSLWVNIHTANFIT